MMTHQIRNRDPKHELLKVLRLLDGDEMGETFSKSLNYVAKEFGEQMTDEELQESRNAGAMTSSR